MKVTFLIALALAGAATAGLVARASPTRTTIRVTEREYSVHLSVRQATAGLTRLEVKNTGRVAHVLAISGAGVSARTKLIRPGKTAVLTVTLEHGAYSLWCPLPGHAARGMKTTLTTPGSTPAGTTTTPPTTTDAETTTNIPPGY